MAPRRNYNKIPVIDKTRRRVESEIVLFRNGEEDHRRPGCRY